MKYTYQAKHGVQVLSGTIEADDYEEAKAILEERDLQIDSLCAWSPKSG